MASNPPAACCLQTHDHNGAPVGKHIDLYGLNTYVSGSKSDKVIVIFTDIYGNKYNNVLLVADAFAKAGYYTLIPDILSNDDAVSGVTDLPVWLQRHTSEITRPIIEKFLSELKQDIGYKFLGAVGYCFGAKYVIQQLSQSVDFVNVGAIAHPSFVSIEEVSEITKPILISAAETDSIFPEELRHKTEDKLKELGATYQLDLFGGVSHGFAVRNDPNDEVANYAAKKTLIDQIYWFDYHSKKFFA